MAQSSADSRPPLVARLADRFTDWSRDGSIETALVLIVATVTLALPLLTVRWLPFVDYPEHIGTIAAIHGQHDPHFAPYFVVEYGRTQYLLLYVLGDWLTYVFGAEGAGRATAILSIASLPLAVAVYLKAHRRPALIAALAAPIAMHAYVFWGFLNYAAGMSLAIAALAAAAKLAQKPNARAAALFSGLALMTFYAHAQLYAWMALACAVQLAAMGRAIGTKRAVNALGLSILAALPSVVAALVWLARSGVIERGEAGSRSGHAASIAAQEGGAIFTPVTETVKQWLSHSFDVYRDGAGVHIAIGFFAAAMVIVMLRSGTAPAAAATDHALAVRPTLAPEIVLLFTFALYLFAPFSYRLIEPINHRFLPLAFALIPVLGPRAALPRGSRIVLGIPLMALAIASAQIHADHFEETDREMGALDDALAEARPGSRLIGLIYDAQSEVIPLPIYLHAHQYYQARVGGLACFGFVEFPKSPVQYAEGAAPPPFPPRFEWTPERYDHAIWGDSFDYWLVRHAPGRASPRIFRSLPETEAPRAIFESDRWTLYAR